MMRQQYQQLADIIEKSDNIVFFTGAGVSVASGIPDFRSMGGLFDEISNAGHSPEYLLSIDHLKDDPGSFISFYKKRLLLADKSPNPVHDFIAGLEAEGRSLGVITQNIDGLHTDAGNRKVDELHGTLNQFYCVECRETYHKTEIIEQDMSYCRCGGVVRPDIVLYGEALNELTVMSAMAKLQKADTLIVLGTSLVVNPAAYLTTYFSGEAFVIINRDSTPFDDEATLVINDDMTDVIDAIT
ncbi:NAD-dependent protein deacylase [Lacicoccus alkaliphilus]|uniref:NAD-dependent protein deacetylase n=1 Tax=Lacicoccus alkaliphilus DSM 16010 TaxID=1123231 RepID=A0A1M7B1W9_9BACL|nr:NAD-dependent deacetylase [Salinicoccus alkaliphilus DSM 16010]